MIYFSLKGDYTKKLKRKGYVSVIILPQSNSTVETATFINTCSSRSTTLLVMLWHDVKVNSKITFFKVSNFPLNKFL